MEIHRDKRFTIITDRALLKFELAIFAIGEELSCQKLNDRAVKFASLALKWALCANIVSACKKLFAFCFI